MSKTYQECREEGCSSPAYAQKLCYKHHRIGLDTGIIQPKRGHSKQCTIKGCKGRQNNEFGLCRKHREYKSLQSMRDDEERKIELAKALQQDTKEPDKKVIDPKWALRSAMTTNTNERLSLILGEDL